MQYNYLTDDNIKQFIKRALQEDIGDGDHSSLASVPQKATNQARLLIKDNGIIAGLEMAKHIFHQVDETLRLEFYKQDGESVTDGEVAFIVSGNAQAILTAERLVLNCMQRMSGIAVLTSQAVNLVKDTNAEILDTRKTTPNARLIEKWAVKIGGGTNHRFGLFDRVMLKDNHIDFAGGITQAVEATKQYLKDKQKDLLIEIETRNLKEVQEALDTNSVDFIMLDNMTTSMMREAVSMIDKRCKTEASGGITLPRLKEIADCGVDYISMGALTHSYQSLDMSLKAL